MKIWSMLDKYSLFVLNEEIVKQCGTVNELALRDMKSAAAWNRHRRGFASARPRLSQ